jgi:DNA-directed RNA polymerase II subunit RPB1
MTVDNKAANRKNKLVPNTVNDPRLGTVGASGICSQCGNGLASCTGHIGKIDLQVPIISAHFIQHICKLLTCICIRCSRLLVPSIHPKLLSLDNIGHCWKKRVNTIAALAGKYRTCLSSIAVPSDVSPISITDAHQLGYCGYRQPDSYILIEHTIVRPVYEDHADDFVIPAITPHHLLNILTGIDTYTCNILGFKTSLAAVFFQCFPIPPLLVRPSRGIVEDDLTIRLRQIVRANSQTIPEVNLTLRSINGVHQLDAPSKIHTRNKAGVCEARFDQYFDLSRRILAYQDHRLFTALDVDYGRERHSIQSRFKNGSNGRGRMRGNLLGKRGDFTARLVASPSTNIHIDECGVPILVLMKLTIAEHVTKYNYNKLLALLHVGSDRYPGANYVYRPRQDLVIPLGTSANIEWRSICTEDHSTSMDMYTHLMSENGLQIGDIVHRHMQRGDWIFLNRQPTLHRFSMMAYKIVPTQLFTIQIHLCITSPLNADFDGDELNLFVPGDIHCTAEATELMSVRENMFKDGTLVIELVQHACLGVYLLTCPEFILPYRTAQQYLYRAGFTTVDLPSTDNVRGVDLVHYLIPSYNVTVQLTKKTINTLLTRHMAEMCSSDAILFMSRINTLFEHIALITGTSLSFTDCKIPTDQTILTHIQQTIQTIQRDSTDDDIEDNICHVLDTVRDYVGQHAIRVLRARHRKPLLDITASGAKGNDGHVVQNAAMVGQQLNGLSRRNTFSTTHEYRTGTAKYGFVSSSFSHGLNAQEFFFHTMSARVGLVATAVDTADTGYTQRRISKCLEDLGIVFDTSVRNTHNHIIMFKYGFDTTHLRIYPIPLLNQTVATIVSQMLVDHLGTDDHRSLLEEIERILVLRNAILGNKRPQNTVPMPVDLGLLVSTYGGIVCTESSFESFRKHVATLWTRMVEEYHVPAEDSIQLLYFYHLSSTNLYKHGYTEERLSILLRHVFHQLTSNVIETDTPIGQRASQSFAAPLTQLNLDRFHISGEKTELVGGVSRIKEIINLTHTSTPSMTIFPLDDTFDTLSLVCLTLARATRSWHDIGCTDNVVLVLELDKDLLVIRRIPPRRICEFIQSNKHLVNAHSDITYSYSELTDEKWCITVMVTPSSVLWTQIAEPSMAKPMLSMYLSHTLLFEDKRLLVGIPRIRDFYETTRQVCCIVDNVLTTVTRRAIITLGSNLMDVCCLPGVDVEFTTTNDMNEIYTVFGIDAVYYAIETGLVDVMLASSASVSRKHVQIIASSMCTYGVPAALTFIGMSTGLMSHLKLATFERALDSFVAAGVYGLEDRLLGTSESIMTGTKISLGTGGNFELITFPEALRISTEDTVLPALPLRLTVPPVLPLYTDPIIRKRLTISDISVPIPIKKPICLVKHRPTRTKTLMMDVDVPTKKNKREQKVPKKQYSKKQCVKEYPQRVLLYTKNISMFQISRTP